MEDQLSIPFDSQGAPIPLALKTSERSDGSVMVGRWSKKRRGRVEVRLDLTNGEKRQPVASFNLEMN